jgi:glycosyltransferase involved in cell wall biosynthesis
MASTLPHDKVHSTSRSEVAPGGWPMSPDFVPGLVSVITPTYNRKQLLLEALGSVVAQTYRPIEMVVIDDGSTDGTVDALRRWFRALPMDRRDGLEFRVVSQENGGAARARNRGLLASRGEFIQFFDSDDLLHPNKLERQVARLHADEDLQYVYSSLTRFSSTPDWSLSGRGDPPPQLDVEHLVGSYRLNTAVGLYRRSICLRIGPWNELLRASDDFEYNLRMILAARAIAFVPGNLFAHRQHPGERLTTGPAVNKLRDLRLIEELLIKQGRFDQRVRAGLAPWYFRMGLAAACQGDPGTAREAARRGLGCPSSASRRVKLFLLALLAARAFPPALRQLVAGRAMAYACRNRT